MYATHEKKKENMTLTIPTPKVRGYSTSKGGVFKDKRYQPKTAQRVSFRKEICHA